uniref:Hsp70h n=9 Tax=Tomato infectious chlorosis virus TaxID=52135 RepID=C0K286_9CLOS|nr:Hsp70h [Tomato infectious chlorosis virus]WRK24207.1 heat shock 70 kDa protein-like protein [Tomato infectious chlorosis virus]
MDCKIGLDFGTTFSTISAYVNGKMFELPLNNTTYISTCIAITSNSDAVIGGAAEILSSDVSPHCFFYDLKRWVGVDEKSFDVAKKKIKPKYSVELKGSEVYITGINKGYSATLSVRQLIKAYIETIVKLFAKTFNLQIRDLNQSVPADYKCAQRLFARSVLNSLSFPCRRIINEPSAAAVYCVSRYPEYDYFLVYDFGGGTFDVSLIAKYKKYVTVVDTEGDSFLGGRDIDMSIDNYLKTKYKLSGNIPAVFLALIKEECNTLGKSSFTVILDNGSTAVIEFSPEELRACVVPFAEKSVEILNRVVSRNGLTTGVVFLVGGSSLLKPVQSVVKQYSTQIGLTVLIDENMRSAVSYGCSLLHSLEDSGNIIYIDCNSHPLSDLSFNCDPSVVVRKPMSIPYKQTMPRKHERQVHTEVNIYEGSDLFCLNNDWLISSKLTSTDYAKVGEPYSIIYEYTIDGIIELSIKNEVTGVISKLKNSFEKSSTIEKLELNLTQLSNVDELCTVIALLSYRKKELNKLAKLFNIPNMLIQASKNYGDFKILYSMLSRDNSNFK